MSAVALLRFSQGLNVGGAGHALTVEPGSSVVIENAGDNSSVQSWRLSLLYGPPETPFEQVIGSPTTLAEDPAGALPGASLPPATAPGSYRIMLEVWDGPGYTGVKDTDIRVFSVPTPSRKIILPPYQKVPDPLPLPETGLPGAKPNELNFEGQAWGWAGPRADVDSFKLMNSVLELLDTAGALGMANVGTGVGVFRDISGGNYNLRSLGGADGMRVYLDSWTIMVSAVNPSAPVKVQKYSFPIGGADFTMPSADGTAGQTLTTNGSGVLSFITPPGATGLPGTLAINNSADDLRIEDLGNARAPQDVLNRRYGDTLGLPYSLAGLVDSGQSYDLANSYTSIVPHDNGTLIYCYNLGTNTIYTFLMSTPYDITTMYWSGVAFVPPDDTAHHRFVMASDGLKFYVSGAYTAKIFQYAMSTAWALNTASDPGIELDVSPQCPSGASSIRFSPTGDKMFIVDIAGLRVLQYTLSTPWLLSSATYDTAFVPSGYSAVLSMDVSDDGKRLFISGTTADGETIRQYNFGTAWLLSSVSSTSEVEYPLAPDDFHFIRSGTLLLTIDNMVVEKFETKVAATIISNSGLGYAYNTLQQLRDNPPQAPDDHAVTFTRATAGDGGGGKWRAAFGAPGTYTDNDGTTIVALAGNGSVAWIREIDDLRYCWEWFGGVPSSPDIGPAIQAAINVLPANGGTVASAKGGTFNVTTGIMIGWGRSGVTLDISGCTLNVNCGATTFLDARATSFFLLKGPAYIIVHSTGHTGKVLDYSGPAGATFFVRSEDLYITGAVDLQHNSSMILDVDGVVWGAFRNIVFNGGFIGVSGRDITRRTYSNVLYFESCTWQNQQQYAVKEFGDSWVFQNCTGEPSSINDASRFYANDGAFAVSFLGCWFGDNTAIANAWIEFGAGYILSFAVIGTVSYNSAPMVKITGGGEGILIAGNHYNGSCQFSPAGIISGSAFVANSMPGAEVVYGGAGIVTGAFQTGNYANNALIADVMVQRQVNYGGISLRSAWGFGPMGASNPFAYIGMQLNDGVNNAGTLLLLPNQHSSLVNSGGVMLGTMNPTTFEPQKGLFVRHDQIFAGDIPYVFPEIYAAPHGLIVPPPASYYDKLCVVTDGWFGQPVLAYCTPDGYWREVGRIGAAITASPAAGIVEKTGDYTIARIDVEGRTLYLNGTGDRTLTLPGPSANIPIDVWFDIHDAGIGRLKIAGAPGVFVDSLNGALISKGTGSLIRIKRVNTLVWQVTGDVVPFDFLSLENLEALYEPEGIVATGTDATEWLDGSGHNNTLLPALATTTYYPNAYNSGFGGVRPGGNASVMRRTSWTQGPLPMTENTRAILVTGWNAGVSVLLDAGTNLARRLVVSTAGTELGIGYEMTSTAIDIDVPFLDIPTVMDITWDATPADSVYWFQMRDVDLVSGTFTPDGTPVDWDGLSLGGAYPNDIWWTGNPIQFCAVLTGETDAWTSAAIREHLMSKFRVWRGV